MMPLKTLGNNKKLANWAFNSRLGFPFRWLWSLFKIADSRLRLGPLEQGQAEANLHLRSVGEEVQNQLKEMDMRLQSLAAGMERLQQQCVEMGREVRRKSLFIDKSDLILYDYENAIKLRYENQESPHDEDFYVLANFPSSDEVFLDIGANFGESAVSFRLFNRQAKIIAFEPNPFLEPALKWLKDREGDKFEYVIMGAGPEKADKDLYFPCLDGIPNFGLASVVASKFSRRWEDLEEMRWLCGARIEQDMNYARIPIEIRPLDEFALSPTLVKIDVENYECQVLQGMTETISRCRPLIMIEVGNRTDPEVMAFLAAHSYVLSGRIDRQLKLVEETTGLNNGFFLAKERLPEYRQRGVLI